MARGSIEHQGTRRADWGQGKEGKVDPIPLPIAELPEGTKVGEDLRVFVYLDSEDRPIATTRTPKITLGEVDFVMVSDIAPFGAFVSWGLKKDLLVPHRE